MNKYLLLVDKYIDKIPVHIRDLIKKSFLLIVAIAALVAIIYGIKKGIQNAEPGGAKLFKKNEDFFYLDKLREENKKKNKIIEDIEVYKDLFESRDENIHPEFKKLGKDTDDRMIGNREEFMKEPDKLRKKEPMFLMDEDKSLEYEKPLPDSQKDKDLDNTPFMKNKEEKEQAVPAQEEPKKTEEKKPDAKIQEDKPSSGMDFME